METITEELRAPTGALFLARKGFGAENARCFPEFLTRLREAVSGVVAVFVQEEFSDDPESSFTSRKPAVRFLGNRGHCMFMPDAFDVYFTSAAVKPSIAPFESLCVDEFVNGATRLAVQVEAALDRAPIRVAPDHIRDTDEHEFYLPGVAKVLADVLTSFEHLQHIPAMLASDRESPATKLDASSTTSSAASSGSGASSTAY